MLLDYVKSVFGNIDPEISKSSAHKSVTIDKELCEISISSDDNATDVSLKSEHIGNSEPHSKLDAQQDGNMVSRFASFVADRFSKSDVDEENLSRTDDLSEVQSSKKLEEMMGKLIAQAKQVPTAQVQANELLAGDQSISTIEKAIEKPLVTKDTVESKRDLSGKTDTSESSLPIENQMPASSPESTKISSSVEESEEGQEIVLEIKPELSESGYDAPTASGESKLFDASDRLDSISSITEDVYTALTETESAESEAYNPQIENEMSEQELSNDVDQVTHASKEMKKLENIPSTSITSGIFSSDKGQEFIKFTSLRSFTENTLKELERSPNHFNQDEMEPELNEMVSQQS